MKMSLIEALEKLAELNNYENILVKIKDDDEPTPIDLEIDDIRKFADDPDQTFDLIVTEFTIRELDENGKEKLGEPLYKVIKEHDWRPNMPVFCNGKYGESCLKKR